MELKPHDLLRIRGVEDHLQGFPFPDWVAGALRLAPWVVVRRAFGTTRRIPIGIRGKERGFRFASWISPDDIVQVISPDTLADATRWKATYDDQLPSQVKGLLAISPLLDGARYKWGPTGSLAYELATGISSIHADSDLDLLVEVPEPISIPAARSLLCAMEALSPVRLDVQMNTPSGGVSWIDYCTADTVLVKTNFSPVLLKKKSLWH